MTDGTRQPVFSPPVPVPTPAPKRKTVPQKVLHAIQLIAAGSTITDAAAKIGWARETLSRRLGRPECREAIRARAEREAAIGAVRAATRLNELIDSSSQRVALEAAKHSLGLAGIKPAPDASVNVNFEFKAGYVIDLSGRRPRDRSFDANGRLVETGPIVDDDGAVIDAKLVGG